jgi:hypothetical protein
MLILAATASSGRMFARNSVHRNARFQAGLSRRRGALAMQIEMVGYVMLAARQRDITVEGFAARLRDTPQHCAGTAPI